MDKLSVSSIKLFKECEQKFAYEYIERLAPITESANLMLGRHVHALLETIYRRRAGADVPSNIAVLRAIEESCGELLASETQGRTFAWNMAILHGISETYEAYWTERERGWRIQGVEGNVEFKDVRGRYDLLIDTDTGLWVVDHKTAALGTESVYEETAPFDFQAMVYTQAVKARGIMYNIVGKPSIRQRQTETREEFVARVATEYRTMPEKYYKRVWVVMNDGLEERLSLTIDHERAKILHAVRTGYYSKNERACLSRGRCPFIALCRGDDARSMFRSRDASS